MENQPAPPPRSTSWVVDLNVAILTALGLDPDLVSGSDPVTIHLSRDSPPVVECSLWTREPGDPGRLLPAAGRFEVRRVTGPRIEVPSFDPGEVVDAPTR